LVGTRRRRRRRRRWRRRGRGRRRRPVALESRLVCVSALTE
jgi:hypothetical protein